MRDWGGADKDRGWKVVRGEIERERGRKGGRHGENERKIG
jgi:hypothetical protein